MIVDTSALLAFFDTDEPDHRAVSVVLVGSSEPLVVPKRSLTNTAAERVDVRVLQVIYALPEADGLFRVGQQVDAYIPARDSRK